MQYNISSIKLWLRRFVLFDVKLSQSVTGKISTLIYNDFKILFIFLSKNNIQSLALTLETTAACLNLKQRLIFFVLQNHWQNICITSIRRALKIKAYPKIISNDKISFSGSQGKLPHGIFCIILKQFHRFHTSVGFNFHVVYPTCNTWFTLAHARGDGLRAPEVSQNFRKENFLSDAKNFQ